MKIKQIMPAPTGYVIVTMVLAQTPEGEMVYPKPRPVVALALCFDDVETDGIVMPLAAPDDGQIMLVEDGAYMVPATTSMAVFIAEAEEEAERINALRKANGVTARPVKGVIRDPLSRERQQQDDLLKELRDQGCVVAF